MGTVFEALDTHTNARVAVKVLHAWRSSPDSLIRFKREFRAAARLSHPHCLPVHDLDRSPAGEWFYTMEFAPGGHLGSQALPWAQVVEIGLQILAALDHIHARRIVHRDIKPQNILIHAPATQGDAPWVKLADFGISKVFDLDEEVGAVVGSLDYLAPEQLEGRADPRSDLYSLGLVMYQAIAGRHPFAGLARAAEARQRRTWRPGNDTEVPWLHRVVQGVPTSIGSLIGRLLSPRPEDRPPTAAAVFDELERLMPAPRALPALTRATYLAQARLIGRAVERQRVLGFVDTVAAGLAPQDSAGSVRRGSGWNGQVAADGRADTGGPRRQPEAGERRLARRRRRLAPGRAGLDVEPIFIGAARPGACSDPDQ